MDSVWLKSSKAPRINSLNGDLKTDVLIIGGGMTGLLCAYMLREAGVSYALVEAKQICSGITKDTTAKITLQHGLIYDKLLRTLGTEKARMYWEVHQKALNAYQNLCQKIDCDFSAQNSFVYSLDDRKKIENEILSLEKIGARGKFVTELPLPISVAGAVQIENQARFHPLKFAYSIARDLNIFENTKVLELIPGCAVTNRGKITAEKIIVATHFPMLSKHGSYFLKLYQHRSYVLALKNAQSLDGMYVDEDKKGLSFRSHQDLLLLGGGGHRTGKKGGNWQELREFVHRHYPAAEETGFWATQDCMSLDGVPYIGLYAKGTRGLYVATGYNKWGMTSAMTAAMVLTDLVCEKHNPYAPLFSPARSVLRPQLAVNLTESAAGLLTPTSPRCPHMGCALKYNPQEHSWDCPCHGSRFTKEGKVINNPATDDNKYPPV